MRALLFFSLTFLSTVSLRAQLILAGQHSSQDYYMDISDTVLTPSCSNCYAHYPIDINGDAIVDFIITKRVWQSPGSTGHYFYVTTKNNNQITFAYIDSCFDSKGIFSQTRSMARAFKFNDTINSDSNWTSDTLSNLSYIYHSGIPSSYTSCSDNPFSSVPSYLGLRVFSFSDTLYGWIKVDVTNWGYGTLYEYACNLTQTGINNFFNESAIKLFPNPVTSILHIEINLDPKGTTAHIEISNTLGQTVYKTETLSNKKIQIDLGVLNKGVYIVKLFDENKVLQQKIIKK